MNTRVNFWNVYCFATNQKRDEMAEDNRQTAAWISHDLIRNDELDFSSMTNLQFYSFFMCIDMNDMFSDILRESDVESSR